MDITYLIYDFLAGPCLFITVPLCIAGIIRKIIIIVSGRNRGLGFPVMRNAGRNADWITHGDSSLTAIAAAGRDPLLAAAGILFHIAIFMALFSSHAHWILIDQSWGILLPGIDPVFTRTFTVTAIFSGFVLILRRTFVLHVLAVSSWKDYAAMLCVLLPFITGLLAGNLVGPYETVMVIHCVSAHILLIAIGWTRLGHLAFYASGRIVDFRLMKRG